MGQQLGDNNWAVDADWDNPAGLRPDSPRTRPHLNVRSWKDCFRVFLGTQGRRGGKRGCHRKLTSGIAALVSAGALALTRKQPQDRRWRGPGL